VGLSPLRAPRSGDTLALKDFAPAVVFAPLGATDSRPVLIVLHGEGADPEAACAAWHKLSDYGFVLCPRGVVDQKGSPGRYTLGKVSRTVLELRAALAALRKRFGDYVAPGPVVIGGVSIGALQAVWILREAPAYFARVVLVLTGRDIWSSGIATIFAQRGGQRVLFVCAGASCRQRVLDDAALTRRSGAGARSIVLGQSDALHDERWVSDLSSDFQWLIAGDPSWTAPGAGH
jgi:poly(3-hydroxybutyrate) depolymerase